MFLIIIIIEHFIRRLPLVHSALKAYENSSSVVKYGAEMIESYAAPIYDKLGYDRKLKEVRYTYTYRQKSCYLMESTIVVTWRRGYSCRHLSSCARITPWHRAYCPPACQIETLFQIHLTSSPLHTLSTYPEEPLATDRAPCRIGGRDDSCSDQRRKYEMFTLLY